MGSRVPGEVREDTASRAGQAAKWAFVIILAAAAGTVGLLQLFRAHPAQKAVGEFFARLQEGDLEGCLELVDPRGQLGSLWEEDTAGVRGTVGSLLSRYRLRFSGLSFSTRAERDAAEVALKGGRVSLYARSGEGPPDLSFDLEGSDLVFYVERREGEWMIEGINYDVAELLAEGRELLPLPLP